MLLTDVIAASLLGIVIIFFVIALSLHKIEKALTVIADKLFSAETTETPKDEKAGKEEEKQEQKEAETSE